MQTKNDLEEFYRTADPWGYRESLEDWKRKGYILGIMDMMADHYHRALDIGAGEGFITEDLNVMDTIEAIEVSDKAASRMHPRIKRVKKPTGKYDLVLASGVLYAQYDYLQVLRWIQEHAGWIVVTCSIKEWEINNLDQGKQIFYAEFPYREMKEVLRVYDFAA